MFNNQKIKELEERLRVMNIRVNDLENYRDNEIFRNRQIKYDLKRQLMTDIGFRNSLENNVASDVLMRLQDKESDVNIERLLKIQLNSMYGTFVNNDDIIVRSNRLRLDKIKDVLNTITGFDWEYKKVENGTSIYYKFYALKHHSDFSISVHELRNEYAKTLKSIVDYALKEELKDV